MNIQNEHFDVIVIGGGASGMMAASTAATQGKRVLLLEKNRELGAKLKITGGGRCNITNATFDHHEMLAYYGDASKFLFSPFSQFDVQSTFQFFESRSLPLKTEARNRVFPETERAEDVFAVLLAELKKTGVEIRTNTRVTNILHAENAVTGVVAAGQQFTADSYILGTGGMSHPETGSTGDGFNWLRELGHTVAQPTPTIVPLATAEEWSHALAGTTIVEMKITFFADNKKAFTKTGPLLFTHFGISGPTILNSAGEVKELLQYHDVTASIDLFPQYDEGALDQALISLFDEQKNKLLRNVLPKLLPSGTTGTIIGLLADPVIGETPTHSVTREQRKALVQILKNLPLTVTGLMGFDRAVVADGGVPLTEIEMKTMRSKKLQNLFITGDLLHIQRPSGGFSLQLCWTTGFVAGTHA